MLPGLYFLLQKQRPVQQKIISSVCLPSISTYRALEDRDYSLSLPRWLHQKRFTGDPSKRAHQPWLDLHPKAFLPVAEHVNF